MADYASPSYACISKQSQCFTWSIHDNHIHTTGAGQELPSCEKQHHVSSAKCSLSEKFEHYKMD